jgi:hypothetical protein
MWATTLFCDELTGDFGGAFEATSIDSCRLFCRLAEIQLHGVLGLLQHYRCENGHRSKPHRHPLMTPSRTSSLIADVAGWKPKMT